MGSGTKKGPLSLRVSDEVREGIRKAHPKKSTSDAVRSLVAAGLAASNVGAHSRHSSECPACSTPIEMSIFVRKGDVLVEWVETDEVSRARGAERARTLALARKLNVTLSEDVARLRRSSLTKEDCERLGLGHLAALLDACDD